MNTTRDELAERVRAVVAEVVGADPGEITDDTNLEHDFHIDSLELMEIGARLEKSVGLRLQLSDLVDLKTVRDAVSLLHRRIQEAS